jgi:hypothetical protein
MMLLDVLSVLLIMNGMIQREPQVFNTIQNVSLTSLYYSIRAQLRNGELNMNTSFYLRCLYENENGNLQSCEDGFLKGPLLVRVRLIQL